MIKKIDKGVLVFSMAYFLYRITLDYLYVYLISPVWEYNNFVLKINCSQYLLSYLWLIAIIVFDYKLYRDTRPSSLFYILLDWLYFIPLGSISPLANFPMTFFFFAFLYWVYSAILQTNVLHKSTEYYKPDEKVDYSSIALIIMSLVILLNFVITIYYNGLHIKFDLEDVYDLRQDMKDLNMPAIVGYIKPMATSVLMILLLASIIHKKFVLVIILSLLELVNFSFGALKSDLFILLIVYYAGFCYSSKHFIAILHVIIAFNLITILEFLIFQTSLLSSVIQRRLLFIPPLLSEEYYTYFSTHELYYLRASFLRWFGISNPYGVVPPNLIGSEYFGLEDMHANTGIIGDDYAQFGWLSLLMYPYFRFLFMKLFDFCSKGVSTKITFFVSFQLAYVFISTSFFAALLTCGSLMMCLVLYEDHRWCKRINYQHRPRISENHER